jgi:hypothetical protein
VIFTERNVLLLNTLREANRLVRKHEPDLWAAAHEMFVAGSANVSIEAKHQFSTGCCEPAHIRDHQRSPRILIIVDQLF